LLLLLLLGSRLRVLLILQLALQIGNLLAQQLHFIECTARARLRQRLLLRRRTTAAQLTRLRSAASAAWLRLRSSGSDGRRLHIRIVTVSDDRSDRAGAGGSSSGSSSALSVALAAAALASRSARRGRGRRTLARRRDGGRCVSGGRDCTTSRATRLLLRRLSRRVAVATAAALALLLGLWRLLHCCGRRRAASVCVSRTLPRCRCCCSCCFRLLVVALALVASELR